ncbi:contractile injection system tape measure protein [Larkinella rosea]|uniref:Uncharacterized protein n=1 Tax=Larkinella rosea TaxID=2025312 RepID=A0A3P1C3D1_9BACT|nr:contractile injection system tape measure protein [Larkinella rosea]RRB07769.1 hypothetical protein EHT25_08340 [Larkinella rosea]
MNHLVHKLVLDLHFPSDEKNLSAINHRIDQEFRDKIVRVVQEVLENVPLHINVFIEKIELDHRGSDAESLIREIKDQLNAQIQQALERDRLKFPESEWKYANSPADGADLKTGDFSPQDAETVWTFESLRYFLETGRFRWETQKLILQQNPDFVFELVRRFQAPNRTQWIRLFSEKPVAFVRFLLYFRTNRDEVLPIIADHFTFFKSDILALLQHLARFDSARLAVVASQDFGRFFDFLKIESPSRLQSGQAAAVLVNLLLKVDAPRLKRRQPSAVLIDRKAIEKITAKGILLSPDLVRMAEELALSTPEIKVYSETTTSETPATLPITNAGVLLLHPFLLPFFDEFKLLSKSRFVDRFSQFKAVQLLHYLTTSRLLFNEDETAFYKILCGIPLDEAVFPVWKLTRKAKKACRELVHALIGHWEVLKNTSPEVAQTEFLQRSGILSSEKTHFVVTMDKKSIDVLLQRLPWGIGMIKLPWAEKLIVVQWD